MATLRITGTDAADNAAAAASIPLTVARFFSSINEAMYIYWISTLVLSDIRELPIRNTMYFLVVIHNKRPGIYRSRLSKRTFFLPR